MKIHFIRTAVSSMLFLAVAVSNSAAQKTLADHCAEAFAETGECPQAACYLVECLNEKKEKADDPAEKKDKSDDKVKDEVEEIPEEPCLPSCNPKECTDISLEDCPEEFCAVMTSCSDEKICHYQMVGEKVPCGDLAYAGQDVECCDEMVKKCGVEFLDGSCDMEGKNSVYNIPICIPCGDHVCGQFEDRCNCPEDCGKPPK